MVTLDNFLRNLARGNLEKTNAHLMLKVKDCTLFIHLDSYIEPHQSVIFNDDARITLEIGTSGLQHEVIYSLMHEVGHFLINQTLSFEERLELKRYLDLTRGGIVKSYILEREISAWETGFEYFTSHGIPVPKGYSRRMIKSLSTYVAVAEEKEYWVDEIGRRAATIAFKEERQ